MKILVFGLPGSGKTTFSKTLIKYNKNLDHYEADLVRKAFDDWDFTENGRLRQANRMNSLAKLSEFKNKHALLDFINPYENQRKGYDLKIFINTIKKSEYEDTNKVFEYPKSFDYEIKNFKYDNIIKEISNEL